MTDREDKVDVEEDPVQNVAAVQVKLPPFWPSKPKLWFTRAEGQFHLRGIKSELTKFHHVLAMMSQETMETVEKAIDDPDPTSAYTDLKKALIARHGPHKVTQIMNFALSHPIPQGSDPLKVKDQVESFGFTEIDQEVGLFLAKMPDSIRHDLLKDADTYEDLTECAMAARRLMGKSGYEPHSVQAISAAPQNSRFFKKKESYRSHTQQQGICWKHVKFGDRAHSCVKPCAWTGRRQSQMVRAIDMEDESGNEVRPY